MLSKLIDFKEIKDTNSGDEKLENVSKKDIAIIGLAGKFGGANNIDEYWDCLSSGKDCIAAFPENRKKDTDWLLIHRGIAEKNIDYYEGAFFKEVDKFDYQFFRISPKEAGLMDPNQRIFLETVWEAIETAGYGGKKLTGTKTGIYIGHSTDFGESYAAFVRAAEPDEIGLAIPGNIKSIIASRIAYLLDLRGPSMLVDTACSSSLMAVHLACQGLRNGECEMAIAGGIKVNLLPAKGLEEGIGIEASGGRAKTFDDSTDGTGFGEGTAALLLKPLSRALEDNDYIYAVIKGSAANQDGDSIGITAPNAIAQEDVISKAWKEAGINPETISYIEAHGTGTKLGDPIEIEGIQMAFEKYTARKQFCAIGSVKTNMGHPDNAAGIVALVKTVLSLKHKAIPPTLHFGRPNRKINFANSPVYINDRLRKWDTKIFPRRCGISSFGLSGTNCHLILEEAPLPKNINQSQTEEVQVLSLSAKSETVLKTLAKKYQEFFNRGEGKSLRDICYTANTGRGHYNYRIAIVFKDEAELRRKLALICEGGVSFESLKEDGIFYGEHKIVEINARKQTPHDITEPEKRILNEAASAKIQTWLNTGAQGEKEKLLSEISQIYIKGADVNWEDLYRPERRRKVELPVYPFKRERCWVTPGPAVYKMTRRKEIDHPLLDGCIAESYGIDIYYSIFNVAKHWVLNEHKVVGNYVVPGTTYLEMAQTAGRRYYSDGLMEIDDLIFVSPLMVNEGEDREVQTIIKTEEGYHEFVVASKAQGENEWLKHAEGKIRRTEMPETLLWDIDELKKKLPLAKDIDYKDIHTGGVEGGPRFKTVKKIYQGTNEVLAHLELPEEYQKDLLEYFLHPALMDSAVNMGNQSVGEGLYLPLSYKKLRVYGVIPGKIFSYLRKKSNTGENVETALFDITVMDEAGKVIVEIENYAIKRVREDAQKSFDTARKTNDFYEFGWIPQESGAPQPDLNQGSVLCIKDENGTADTLIQKLKNEGRVVIEAEFGASYQKISDQKYIIAGDEDDYRRLTADLKERNLTRIILMNLKGDVPSQLQELIEAQRRGLYSLYYLTRALVHHKFNEPIDIVLVAKCVNEVTKAESRIHPHYASLFGLAKVISQEYTNLGCRCIDIDDETTMDQLIKALSESQNKVAIALRGHKRYVEEFRKTDLPALKDQNLTVKEGGVYLISGGTGGIGLAIAKYLASKNKVNICLVSRSKIPERQNRDAVLEAKEDAKLCKVIAAIREIESSGSKVACYSADVADYEALRMTINALRKEFGGINGVFHCAGLAGDGFIIRKEESVFKAVIAPKVYGTFNLDNLTATDKPDFFVMFSSISSLFGVPGQGDYTAANSYLDSFAAYSRKQGKRTIAINWPMWKETGMAVDYKVNSGEALFKPVETKKGLEMLEMIIDYDLTNIVPGELDFAKAASMFERISVKISGELKAVIEKQRPKPENISKEKEVSLNVVLKGKISDDYSETEKKVAHMWAETLGFSEVDINDNFYNLGGDSILATRLLKIMQKDFPGIIDIADIFTYSTINDMSRYIESRLSPPQSKLKDTASAGEDLDDILNRLAKGEISVKDAVNLTK